MYLVPFILFLVILLERYLKFSTDTKFHLLIKTVLFVPYQALYILILFPIPLKFTTIFCNLVQIFLQVVIIDITILHPWT